MGNRLFIHQKIGEASDTDDTPWGGKDGIITKIRKDLLIPRGTSSDMIRNTLTEYLIAKEGGYKWEPFIDRAIAE